MTVTTEGLLHLELNSDGCRKHPTYRDSVYSAVFIVSQSIPSLRRQKLVVCASVCAAPRIPTVG